MSAGLPPGPDRDSPPPEPRGDDQDGDERDGMKGGRSRAVK